MTTMTQKIKELFLSKEVRQAINETRFAVDSAMEATQMIESIYVTKKLTEMFDADSADMAEALNEDYYAELLIGRMIKKQEEEAEEEVIAWL